VSDFSQSAPHSPVEIEAEVWEDVGGVRVWLGFQHQVRCGCTVALQNDWGHDSVLPEKSG
jgi:hypothetical protein